MTADDDTLLLAIDQGTTGTTVLLLDLLGRSVARATRELPQHFPADGWVEHDPEEIWASVLGALREALRSGPIDPARIGAVGITNQRETALLWERATGRPLGRAVVWQDRRTAGRCAELRQAGHAPLIRERTGLVIDPYFAGTKFEWLLDQSDELRRRGEAGELCLGTVDSYLVYRLAGGPTRGVDAPPPHVTDVTNASRTMLMDLRTGAWDDDLCTLLRVPRAALPTIVGNAEVVARTRHLVDLPDGVPIAGLAGDQHAALFGQACFEAGDAKCTYGTGAFVLANTGSEPVPSKVGLLSTVAWRVGGRTTYALEGSCFIAGAAVQWLRDGLGLIRHSAEVETLARQVTSSDGVVFVPALAGLGAPHWDPNARGLLWGMTRGTTAAHVARATLEAIAFQVEELVAAMSADFGQPVKKLRVDGGAAANDLLMQFQADVSGVAVERPRELESTARGAAMLAGVGAGLVPEPASAATMHDVDRRFDPAMPAAERRDRIGRWSSAVQRCMGRPVDVQR